MIMHGPGEVVVDMEPIVSITRPESALDIPRSADGDGYGTVIVERVVEEVVIVADSRDGSNHKGNVLCGGDVGRCEMTLDGIARVVLKETQAVWVDVSRLANVKRGVEVCRVRGAIKAVHEVPLAGPEAVRGVEVGRRGMERILRCVMRHGLLEAELVDEALALVANVMELQTDFPVVGQVEAEIHYTSRKVNTAFFVSARGTLC